MIRRQTHALGCVLIAGFTLGQISSPAWADSITLTSANLYVWAYDGSLNGAPVINDKTPSALPYADSDTVTAAPSTATAIYGLTTSSFDVQSTLARAGGVIPNAYAIVNGSILFTANQAVGYTLSGYLDATNPEILQEVFLRDDTINSNAFFQLQAINNYVPSGLHHFDLGTATGDPGFSGTSLQGSLTGTLIAGHNYTFYYENTIKASPNQDGGASGGGETTLVFTPVPLPSAALGGLLMIGLFVLARTGRNFRQIFAAASNLF